MSPQTGGYIMIAIGLGWSGGFLFAHARAARQAKAAEMWRTTMGKILSSDVVAEETGDRTMWFRPVVTYRYEAGGRTWEGSRIRFGNVRKTLASAAQAVIAPYPGGASRTIRYNPERPEESVLETAPPWRINLYMAIGGLFFIALGLFFFWAASFERVA